MKICFILMCEPRPNLELGPSARRAPSCLLQAQLFTVNPFLGMSNKKHVSPQMGNHLSALLHQHVGITKEMFGDVSLSQPHR